MILTQTIPWSDFSYKHKHYIHNAQKSRICVATETAEEARRSVDNENH